MQRISMRTLLSAALFITACGTPPRPPDRAQELADCRRISISGDALGRCLTIKYDWAPATAGPAKTAWQRHLDSLRAGTSVPAPRESAEEAAAHARRWADCVFRETGADWEKESIAEYNCRSDLPDVHALIDYAKTLPYDSSRVLLEVYGAVER